jgi:hypothetical protein
MTGLQVLLRPMRSGVEVLLLPLTKPFVFLREWRHSSLNQEARDEIVTEDRLLVCSSIEERIGDVIAHKECSIANYY